MAYIRFISGVVVGVLLVHNLIVLRNPGILYSQLPQAVRSFVPEIFGHVGHVFSILDPENHLPECAYFSELPRFSQNDSAREIVLANRIVFGESDRWIQLTCW